MMQYHPAVPSRSAILQRQTAVPSRSAIDRPALRRPSSTDRTSMSTPRRTQARGVRVIEVLFTPYGTMSGLSFCERLLELGLMSARLSAIPRDLQCVRHTLQCAAAHI